MEERFKAANNVLDLYRIAHELKAEGFDESEVNATMSKCRSEMAGRKQKVTTLKRVNVHTSNVPNVLTMTVAVQVRDNNPNSNSIEIGTGGLIIL